MKVSKLLLLFFILLVLSMTLVGFGCKPAEKEKTISESGEEITKLIEEIDALDLELELGDENLTETEELL